MQFSKETILFSFTARINFKTQFCIQENLSQELDALSWCWDKFWKDRLLGQTLLDEYYKSDVEFSVT